jgi:Protein of unknown function (DUF3131)
VSPNTIHELCAQGKPWFVVAEGAILNSDVHLVSTAAAFAYSALWPNHDYVRQLGEATTDLYNPLLGYYEGFNEQTGKTVTAFSASTNCVILPSLLYTATNRQPLMYPLTSQKSPWWQAIAQGDSDRG